MQRKLSILFYFLIPILAIQVQAMPTIEWLKKTDINQLIKAEQDELKKNDAEKKTSDDMHQAVKKNLEKTRKKIESQQGELAEIKIAKDIYDRYALFQDTEALVENSLLSNWKESLERSIERLNILQKIKDELTLENKSFQAPGGPKKDDEDLGKQQASKEQAKEKAQHKAAATEPSKAAQGGVPKKGLEQPPQAKWTANHDTIADLLQNPTGKNIQSALTKIGKTAIDTKAKNVHGLTLQDIANNSASFHADLVKNNAANWNTLMLAIEPR
jgi:hypothetical protein